MCLCVAACITLVVLGILVWSRSGFDCSNPHRDAKRDMEGLYDAMRLYQLHTEQLPKTLDDLVEAGAIRRLVLDPWGSEYELHVAGTRWAIRCAGVDQEHGTLDDLYVFGPDLDRR